jgi:hypothetical protein
MNGFTVHRSSLKEQPVATPLTRPGSHPARKLAWIASFLTMTLF